MNMWNWWAETLVFIQTTPCYFYTWEKCACPSQQQIECILMMYFILIICSVFSCVGCYGTIAASP